ncbi:hypothetical protein L218DRAFT_386504 [Marasmius fiardii PR-910]|nr:hypothetical protein L218DRAFT_386504 [Marasmius fiardii PR-910]
MISFKLFEAASNMTFSGGQSFNSANKIVSVNNFNFPALPESEYGASSSKGEEQWVTLPSGTQRLRVIDMCDVIILKQISLENRTSYSLGESDSSKPTNPSVARLERQRGSVKIRKRVQTAEIIQYGDRRFTVIAFEPEHEEDAEKIRKVLQLVCEAALSSRSAYTNFRGGSHGYADADTSR